jgi:hypothetical protein
MLDRWIWRRETVRRLRTLTERHEEADETRRERYDERAAVARLYPASSLDVAPDRAPTQARARPEAPDRFPDEGAIAPAEAPAAVWPAREPERDAG